MFLYEYRAYTHTSAEYVRQYADLYGMARLFDLVSIVTAVSRSVQLKQIPAVIYQ